MDNLQASWGELLKTFLYENRVALSFFIICILAFYFSGMSTVVFFSEISVRLGRDTFLVLSLLIPIVAGLGLNFGIVVGAMSAQIAMFLVVLWGGSGLLGIGMVALVATPIAILLGYLVGKLFNNMKGSEMVGGMVTALFADGFYQLLFLFIFGGVITIGVARLVTPTGVGVVNVIDLNQSPAYLRQVIDDVSMLGILNIAIWVMIAYTLIVVIVKLVKKRPIEFKGPGSIRLPVVVTAFLIIAFIASGFGGIWWENEFTYFLYQDRLNALYAIWYGCQIAALVLVGLIVKYKFFDKMPGFPTKLVFYLIMVGLLFGSLFIPAIYHGLINVGFPVFTYLIIAGLCVAIKWFMNTRLGQNMRAVGQSRPVATAAGIDVDRTRIIAMIISTVLAAYGQIIAMQNFGLMVTYGAHVGVGASAIAAILVGGATVTNAKIKHAIIGVLLFHSLFILSPFAGANLMGSALIGEYFRVFVSFGVIAFALVMHAWKRAKVREKPDAQTPVVGAAKA